MGPCSSWTDKEIGTLRGGEAFYRSHSMSVSVDCLWAMSLGWVLVAAVTDLQGEPASSCRSLTTITAPKLHLSLPLSSRLQGGTIPTVFHVLAQKQPPNAPVA